MTEEQQVEEQKVFRDEEEDKKSSTGLENNVAGLLCYLFGFITGLIFLLVEKDSKFVRYHAFQSIFIWVSLFVLSMVIGFVPLIGWLISLLLAPVGFVIWIVCMIKAYQGKWFKFPVVGNIAEEQVNKMNNEAA
ncbi:DUF4870 domain-containing protein [Alkalibacillus haloalkaliphilus]|uniref:DUF4870 domain-containing protein n=1 Tax=Alkalibacillus haloalkaliphilus TaxID=94136 RepID=UPI002936A9E1|nr:DUF4870 domain-containing protein [Alkalibacillus haloalkaliphilus]MDV2583369.1 DUF4870 domain-containing protein [Alkalibacillus haloalkaliphilus]